MAVPYHTHTFEIPFATKDDVTAGTSSDKAVVPSSLGSAASRAAEDFATSDQGAKADTAIQPDDLPTVAVTGSYNDLSDKPSLGTAASQNTEVFATASQGAKADSAVQPGSLSTVATSGAYGDLSGKPTLGTASAQNVEAFATAAQGAKADTAVQTTGTLTISGDIFAKGSSGAEVDLAVKTFGGPSPVMHGYQARGTEGTPTAVQSGDLLFGIGSRPHQGDGYTPHSTGAIHWYARENFSSGHNGTSMRVLVTPTGGGQADRKEVVRFESDSLTTGTRIRITGAGSLADRTYIQSKDAADISTTLGVLPPSNDSAAAGSVIAFNNTDPANSGYAQLQSSKTVNRISSNASGTGTVLPLAVQIGGTEWARWANNGRLYLNTTAPLSSYTSDNILTIRSIVGSAIPLRLETDNASGTLSVFVTNAGLAGSIFSSGTTTTYSQTSDQRLKIDDGEISEDACLAILELLRFHAFRWEYDNSADMGVFAQELYAIYPKAVVVGHGAPGDEDFTPWGVDYSKLVPVLGRCLQSVNRRLRNVEDRLDNAV